MPRIVANMLLCLSFGLGALLCMHGPVHAAEQGMNEASQPAATPSGLSTPIVTAQDSPDAENDVAWQLLTPGNGSKTAISPAPGGVVYSVSPRWQARVAAGPQQWLQGASTAGCDFVTMNGSASACSSRYPRLSGSRVGASFMSGKYSVNVGLDQTHSAFSGAPLPRVLPRASVTAGMNGVPYAGFGDSTSLHAGGRWALGNDTGIHVGAGLGRIRLRPGAFVGSGQLEQRSLSIGMDRGRVSGQIVGHVVQPAATAMDAFGPEKRWTRVDLGVTWHLSNQGALRFGARNMWSSGHAPGVNAGSHTEVDDSRIPYVQYHQDF